MNTLVIGSGMAGLSAALMLKKQGKDVTVITRGFGGMQLSEGLVSIDNSPAPLRSIAKKNPAHPYSKIGREHLEKGIAAFTSYIPLEGSLEKATALPTALGSIRWASFYPSSYGKGALEKTQDYLLVGFSGMKDFYPHLAAGNLMRQGFRVRAEKIEKAFPGGETTLAFSRHLAREGEAEKLGRELAAAARGNERIGIPAILRDKDFELCARASGRDLFQIPVAPPSIIGMEWNERLRQACCEARIDILLNAQACTLTGTGSRIRALQVRIAGQQQEIPCDSVIYAGGGIDSGAIERDSYGKLTDTVFNAPIYDARGIPVNSLSSEEISLLVNPDFWGAQQPLFGCGLGVDSAMHVLDEEKNILWDNFYAVGSMISGAMRAREKSGEGIALGSAHAAVSAILQEES